MYFKFMTLFKNYLESLQTALADLRGALGTRASLSIEFLLIPCSFRQTFCQIIGWHPS